MQQTETLKKLSEANDEEKVPLHVRGETLWFDCLEDAEEAQWHIGGTIG